MLRQDSSRGGKKSAKLTRSSVRSGPYQDIGHILSEFPQRARMQGERRRTIASSRSAITDTGDFYPTLAGPAKTVEKHKKDFDEFLKNFK